MTNQPIGVGIIGASLQGWAATAHIPALKLLPGFRLAAVSTSSLASATAAAQAFGAPHAFDNAQDLVDCPAVALVVVAVKVPHHQQLVAAALAAGKTVYCEWPLGNGTAEAEAMAASAAAHGVRTFTGLQALSLPETHYLKQALADGLVGEVLSTTVVGSGRGWAAFTDERNAYTLDPANGCTLLTIPFGHTVAAVEYVLGGFQRLNATLARRRTDAAVLPDRVRVPQLTQDQIAVNGLLAGGAVASLHYRAGLSAGLNFHWEINGTKGDLVVQGPLGHYQLAPVTVQYAPTGQPLQPVALPAALTGAPAPAQPVRGLYYAYRAVLHDLRHGTQQVPSFQEALHFHRLLDRIEQAAQAGVTVAL